MDPMKFPPSHIVLHTAAFRGPANAKTIKEWHLEKGWEDIGYHFVITGSFYDNNCEIEKGRSLTHKGAHALGTNNSIGICLTGHGDHIEWTYNQIKKLSLLCKYLMLVYNIPIEKVIGHRDTWLQRLNPTKTCPGKLIDMKEVRKHILYAKYNKLGDKLPITIREAIDA